MAHFGKGGGQMEAYYVYGTPIHCGLQLEWWDLVNLKMPWTTLRINNFQDFTMIILRRPGGGQKKTLTRHVPSKPATQHRFAVVKKARAADFFQQPTLPAGKKNRTGGGETRFFSTTNSASGEKNPAR